ncbi:hypothetical protein [Halorussus aquaticus]|uniref:Uncharacterized protein n=1 Tax=Halorussus aquaticus TaxID=2953748 RepID=A0ABD5PXN9_9EURY|nr:hypothetical protein [Halorussus aquaticus]
MHSKLGPGRLLVLALGIITMGVALAAVVWVGVTEFLHSPPRGAPRSGTATNPAFSYLVLLLLGAGVTAFGLFGLR